MVRLPFSLYSGWVTGAMILNSLYMMKSLGAADVVKVDPKANGGVGWAIWAKDLMFIDEEDWTIIVLWTLEIFFEIVQWWERNPIWGAVYAWAGSAILANNVEKQEILKKSGKDNTPLLGNLGAILGIHSFSLVMLMGYLIFEELQPWYEPIEFWQGGIFGMVDWSVMPRQLRELLAYPEDYLKETYATREAVVM